MEYLRPSELKWDKETGLLPCITQDKETQEVLMLAYMNQAALEQTLAEGLACYYSRSRAKLWVKGESSGHYQKVCAIYVDCDADTILLQVQQTGVACHTGAKTCFFRGIKND